MTQQRMLVLTGGPNHDFEHAARRLAQLLSPGFEVEATSDVKDMGKLRVGQFAGAVIFTCEKKNEPPEVFEEVREFVERGGGLVLIHAAMTSFADRPGWKELIGAEVSAGKLDQRYALEWDDADHAVVKGVEAWEMEDEHYQMSVAGQRGQLIGPASIKVFASSIWDGGRYVFGYERGVGKGKIVGLAAGHRSATLDDARYGRMIQQAAEYVAGK